MAKMDKSVQKTVIIVGGVLIALLMIFLFISNFAYPKTISATGTSSVKVLPDLVGVYFNVESTGVNASQATDKNLEIYNRLVSALVVAGIPESDIKTENFNVYPEYDYNRANPVITGYRAVHSIKIKIPVSEKNKIGNVIDAGVSSGAGIAFINYELNDDNQRKYKTEAIQKATEDARTKAEALATGSGSRLGSLVSVSSSEWGYVPWLAASEMDVRGSSGAEVATKITPSEQEISAMVTAVFRIK